MKRLFFILCLLFFPVNVFAALTVGYTSATDTMLIKGATSGSPATWAQVWDYDTAAGGETNGAGETDGPDSVELNTLMTETVAGRIYIIDCLVDIGESGTATYFASENEHTYFTADNYFEVQVDAVARFGVKDTATSANDGCSIFFEDTDNSNTAVNHVGTLYLYATNYVSYGSSNGFSGDDHHFLGTHEFIQAGFGNLNRIDFGGTMNIVHNAFVWNCWNGFISTATTTATGLTRIISGPAVSYGMQCYNSTVTIKDSTIDDGADTDICLLNNITDTTFNMVDCILPSPIVVIIGYDNHDGFLNEQYTVNIHVVDKDGANIATASVTCNDQFGTSVFDVNTDANGDIAEQTVTYKHWETTAETLTTYSPHTFVISKAGLRTQTVIYNFSDGKIDWEIELDDGDTVIYDSVLYDMTVY